MSRYSTPTEPRPGAAPEVLVTRDERASATIRAAMRREPAAAVGVELGPETAVTLNGLSLSTDGEPPLVAGDVIALSAT
jgi:hypothetical protein